MNIKYLQFPTVVCLLSIMIVSIIPGSLANPSVAQAAPGIMKWEIINTPNADPQRNDVLNPVFPPVTGNFTGSEIRDLAVGNDGVTLIAAVNVDGRYVNQGAGPLGVLFTSNNGGITWSISAYQHLRGTGGWGATDHVYNVAIAPDDVKIWAATAGSTMTGPSQLWISRDGGATWDDAGVPGLALGEAISAIDISVNHGRGHDILVATRSGAGAGRLFIMNDGSFGSWREQISPLTAPLDYFAARFSPTYPADSSVVVVYADDNQTCYNIGYRDINGNSILNWAWGGDTVEVKSSSAADNISPSFASLAVADLALPSDFSGQSASLRRAFISLFSFTPGITDNQTGIFRIDDTVPASLLNTSTSLKAQIYSIAFFGTYSTGKLLAGYVYGSACDAAVPTMFMDTPCTCSGSCGYKSIKPPTGAGNQGNCTDNGTGAAIVAWNFDGSLAYAITGSAVVSDNTTWWDSPYRPNPWISALVPNDESAFSISRNNGETWNQLALIDTTIDWFNDVAVSPECTTVYIASVHRNAGMGCDEFDSVWRSTVSPAVASPLPALAPVGTYWERVLTHATSGGCNFAQSDLPLLRVVESCSDKQSGGVVAWAAQYTQVQAWSPDYGDYWQMLTSRDPIQDFVFESSTIIYNLSPAGMVQKLVYTGTSWATTLPSTDTTLSAGHTIAAHNGRVLVGAGGMANADGLSTAFSADSAQHWYVFKDRMPTSGNVHVIFDVDYENNSFVYAADDNATGTVYRNTAPNFIRWDSNDMMEVSNGAAGSDWWNDGYSHASGDPPHQVGQYGIVMAFTGNPQPALYSVHENITISMASGPGAGGPSNSGVCRTLEPRNGMPKPGIYWDCLDIFTPANQTGVHFTLEPSSLKACGCCTLDTNTTLWAIDNESGNTLGNPLARTGRYLQDSGYRPDACQGMLWAYIDCLAKKGPTQIIPADGALVGADPVTGRSQQIDLSWEQLCLSTVYQIDIAKDKAFTLRIIVDGDAISNAVPSGVAPEELTKMPVPVGAQYQHITVAPPDVTKPATWLSPGALPEAGATYYWRVRSYQSATGQIAVSPYSEVHSFAVKPGFIVVAPYQGVQLLSPNNGCMGCKIRPALFSWSPWKDATLYEFELSRDAEFNQVVKRDTATMTAYEYDGQLDYDTTYFWRVRAIEIDGKPISSDWSASFSFRTEAAPSVTPVPAGEPVTPMWIWVVIGIGVILVIITLLFILRVRS